MHGFRQFRIRDGKQGDLLVDPICTHCFDTQASTGDKICERTRGEVAKVVGDHQVERRLVYVVDLNEKSAARGDSFPQSSQHRKRIGKMLQRVDQGDKIKLLG